MSDQYLLSLKPIWLLGCGTALGLFVLAVIWILVTAISRRAGAAMLDLATRSVSWPVLAVAVVLSFSTLLMSVMDMTGSRFFDQKKAAWQSVLRLSHASSRQIKVEVPAGTKAQAIPLGVPEGELNTIQFLCNGELLLTVNEPFDPIKNNDERLRLQVNEPNEWVRGNEPSGPLAGAVDTIFASNDGAQPVTLSIKYTTLPVVPQASLIPVTAVGLVGYFGVLLLLQLAFPKVSAVALATAREAMAQPLFYLVLIGGWVLLLGLVYTPFFTFGEDVKSTKTAA